MTSKITSTLTAAAISMSITFAAPVGVIAVANLTAVSEAQAGFFKTLKKNVSYNVKKVKAKARVVKRNCFSGHQGICGRALDPNWRTGRIGELANRHDHRKK